MSDVMSRATDPEASVPYDDFPTDNLSVYPWMKGRTPSEVLKEQKLKRQKAMNPQEDESVVASPEKDEDNPETASNDKQKQEEEAK